MIVLLYFYSVNALLSHLPVRGSSIQIQLLPK